MMSPLSARTNSWRYSSAASRNPRWWAMSVPRGPSRASGGPCRGRPARRPGGPPPGPRRRPELGVAAVVDLVAVLLPRLEADPREADGEVLHVVDLVFGQQFLLELLQPLIGRVVAVDPLRDIPGDPAGELQRRRRGGDPPRQVDDQPRGHQHVRHPERQQPHERHPRRRGAGRGGERQAEVEGVIGQVAAHQRQESGEARLQVAVLGEGHRRHAEDHPGTTTRPIAAAIPRPCRSPGRAGGPPG
jgi:hypothetical protein